MKKSYFTYFISCFVLFSIVLFSCKKDLEDRRLRSYFRPEGNFESDKPYQLNVIYFVAKDRQVNRNYEHRISGILLHGQDFFSKWMEHWGYGKNRTFGLSTKKSNNRYGKEVKIIVLLSNYDSQYYSYNNDGGRKMIAAVDNLYKYIPQDKTSDHYLIIS